MTDVDRQTRLVRTRIAVPESLQAADAGPFLEMVRIANAVCRADAGHDYLDEQADEVFGFWQDQSDWIQIGYAAERDGVMLGAVKIMFAHQDDVASLDFDLMVDPPRR